MRETVGQILAIWAWVGLVLFLVHCTGFQKAGDSDSRVTIGVPSVEQSPAPQLVGEHVPLAWAVVMAHRDAVERNLPLTQQSIERTAGEWVIRNPIHSVIARVSDAGVQLSGPRGGGWDLKIALHTGIANEAGAREAMRPRVKPCPKGAGCDARVERRHANLTEWYANTLQGLLLGFEISESYGGRNPLVVDAGGFTTLEALSTDGGHTVVLSRGGEHALTHSILKATDANGRHLKAALSHRSQGVTLAIQAEAATFPLQVVTAFADCPASWCDDVDRSTLDVCNSGGARCVSAFDARYEGRQCEAEGEYGAWCCADGRLHATCPQQPDDEPLEATACPPSWCDDADPNTLDSCVGLELPSAAFQCEHSAAGPPAESEGHAEPVEVVEAAAEPIEEIDSDDVDTDGVPDEQDRCAGADDNLDTDGDGIPNCADVCPLDGSKSASGHCGCGIPDTYAPDCSACGNDALDPDEQCDDGNQTDGDGCSAFCALETDCCWSRAEPRCDDEEVTACVCAMDDLCCGEEWDPMCVNLARSCGATCPPAGATAPPAFASP